MKTVTFHWKTVTFHWKTVWTRLWAGTPRGVPAVLVYVPVQLGRQFISLVFSSDCSEPDAITQHSEPLPVLSGEMPYAGSCLPAFEKKINTASDPRSFPVAGAGGVAAPCGVFTNVCAICTSAGIWQLPAAQIAQVLHKPFFQSVSGFIRVEKPGFDEGDAGHQIKTYGKVGLLAGSAPATQQGTGCWVYRKTGLRLLDAATWVQSIPSKRASNWTLVK
ncbi:MAG: hypothetical protein ABF308_04325, partial [Phaeobacter gallaeciensis]